MDNFIGGIGWALGATIGGSVILAILAIALKQINVIPIVGNFVIEVSKFINEHNPNLR